MLEYSGSRVPVRSLQTTKCDRSRYIYESAQKPTPSSSGESVCARVRKREHRLPYQVSSKLSHSFRTPHITFLSSFEEVSELFTRQIRTYISIESGKLRSASLARNLDSKREKEEQEQRQVGRQSRAIVREKVLRSVALDKQTVRSAEPAASTRTRACG